MNEGQYYLKFAQKLKESLSKDLFGQDRAIEAVANSMKNNIIENSNGPAATYLFLGSPATGKTYLAELMTQNLKDYKIIKFDMTQYHQQNGGELYGYPIGWTGYGVGQLTGFVNDNPKSIVVLDAFEKCDNIIQNNLLSIFEGGKMRDGCGWDMVTGDPCNENEDVRYTHENARYIVDFTQTIFVITSSLGKELYTDNRFAELVKNDYIQAESMILEAIRREEKRDTRSGGTQQAIIPELVSRFSQANIVLFNKLTYPAFEKIAQKAFMEYLEIFTESYEMEFSAGSSFKNFIKAQVLNFAPELDARRIKDKVTITFFDRITEYLMSLGDEAENYKKLSISVSKKVVEFFKENVDPLIEEEKLVKELFRKNTTLNLEDKITARGDTITYRLNGCEFKQVKRIKDFSEDGLVFDIPSVTFDDIAGHIKAKMRLREVINFFKKPKELDSFKIQPPKGMLLYGPPGTGKTMLAKAFANEAGLPFISITGLELLHPEKTKQVFAKAKEYAPAIIFIDEIDTIGRRGEEKNREIPINKFLSEMDGFNGNSDENIFVIAATNYKDSIDPAIIRPGRIEIHIEIDNLDKEARQYFINKIIFNKPIAGDFDINKLLMYTTGLTGAQLELVGKEASFYCLRNGLPAITQEILLEQINTVKYGEKQSHLTLEQMFEETAIYESGRAVISRVLMPHIQVESVNLIPKKDLKGFKSHDYDDVQDNMTVKDFKDKICVSLAGRIAQIKKFGDVDGVDTGASNDLQQATRDAYTAIAYYGMDKEVGYINLNGVIDAKENPIDTKHYHEKIDIALGRWMQESESVTKELIQKHWDKIELIASKLLEQEVIYSEELDALLG